MDAWEPILEQIENSDFFLVLISSAALASAPVIEEIDHAHYARLNNGSRRPVIIPICLEAAVEIPRKIRRFGRIDLSAGKEYEPQFITLLRTIGLNQSEQTDHADGQPEQQADQYEDGQTIILDRSDYEDLTGYAKGSPDAVLIWPGVGLKAVRIGGAKDTLIAKFGNPTKVDGGYLCYYDKGIDALVERDRIKVLFFYFHSPGHSMFLGCTSEGIGGRSSIEDVRRIYGVPDNESRSIISEFGAKPGARELTVSFSRKGISFTFYDGELADIRIYVPKT
jgi:hypothetical protein